MDLYSKTRILCLLGVWNFGVWHNTWIPWVYCSLLFYLLCHLLVAFHIVDKVGVSEVAKYVAREIFFDKILSGHDSNFSLGTLDVLEQRISFYIYRFKYNLLHSSRWRELVAELVRLLTSSFECLPSILLKRLVYLCPTTGFSYFIFVNELKNNSIG